TFASVGDRLTRTRVSGSTAYVYDRPDRMTSAAGIAYSYDPRGNLTQRGSDTFIAYDQANRIILAVIAGVASSFIYVGDGKRASATFGANPATRYVYDVNRPTSVMLDDGVRKYVYGGELAYTVSN